MCVCEDAIEKKEVNVWGQLSSSSFCETVSIDDLEAEAKAKGPVHSWNLRKCKG